MSKRTNVPSPVTKNAFSSGLGGILSSKKRSYVGVRLDARRITGFEPCRLRGYEVAAAQQAFFFDIGVWTELSLVVAATQDAH